VPEHPHIPTGPPAGPGAPRRDDPHADVLATEEHFESILRGEWDADRIASFLTAIAARPPTADELIAGARVLRRHLTPVPAAHTAATLIDTCGTGGAPKTFNISTIAAIVIAAAAPGEVAVAKHGGRSRSGRGSAEVLARLGVNVDAPPEAQSRCLAEAGVCFCFSVNHHPAMRHVAPVRKSLGFPTIFNLLGPLANPAGVRRQVIGTYSPAVASTLAAAVAALGADHVLVVSSRDGLDELTTTSTTVVHEVRAGTVTTRELDARSLGLPLAPLAALQAADLDHAVEIFRAVLGAQRGAPRDVVLLNAAAGLVVGGFAPDFATGIEHAQRAIDTGAAAETLESLARLSNS
jgi:anthranilate phosphoribosyltransferase